MKKRMLSIVLTLCMVLTLVPTTAFAAESITPTTPERDRNGVYQIGTKEELYWFADKVNNDNVNYGSASAVLTADIVVNTGVLKADGTLNTGTFTSWTPVGDYSNTYTGTFDGQGHTISGLYFKNSAGFYTGLFGFLGGNGEIKNVGVIDSYFKGDRYVGGVCGYNRAGIITGCYNTGTVSGNSHIGGVCGYNRAGRITGCYSTGTVSGTNNVGGVCGYAYDGTITGCYTNRDGDTYYRPNDEFTNDTVCGLLNTALKNENANYRYYQGANYPELCGIPKLVDGVYQISCALELYGFAQLENDGNAGITSKLLDDIELSSTLNLSDKKITLDLNGHILTCDIKLADSSAAPDSILTLTDSNKTATHTDKTLPLGGVLKGGITLTRGNGQVSHLYANGGTIMGMVSMPSYAGGIYCTSNTPTAFKGYVGNYGEVHGGIFYGSINESCIKGNTKTVTFMNDSSRYALEVVADGNKVAEPVNPTKEGFVFAGWYKGGTKYDFNQSLTESITLTAKWVSANVSNEAELNIAINGGITSIKLVDDINLSSTLIIGKSIVLDLNGHVIRLTGNGSVIRVKGSLTLEDSNPTATHTGENGSLPDGGVITGGNDSSGAGVNIDSGASFVMNSGTINNCIAENGGGVGNAGSFVMNGGTISECGAKLNGGGVYNNASFVMNGGSIVDCYAGQLGDGVYNSHGATTMRANGGEITGLGNNAADLIIEKDEGKIGTTFYGTVINTLSTINAGIYKTMVTNSKGTEDTAPGTISGGTFESTLVNEGGGIISGGMFKETVMNEAGSTISGGTFIKSLVNKGTVNGGVYYGGIQNKDSGTVTGTQYTVSFDLNGGSGSVQTQLFVNVNTATALKPANPTREGYAFAGWYNGDTEYSFTEAVKKSITLTAMWSSGDVSTEAELNIAINAGGPSIKLVDDIELSNILDLSNKEITLDLNGHVLTGSINLADTAEEPQSILTLIDSNAKATHTDSNLPVGGVINGGIMLTRANGNGTASHLYANGGTVTGRVSTVTDIAKIYCTSSTPTAFTGTVGYYGEIHGGIFYGSTNDGCIKEKTVTFMNGNRRYALEVVADGTNAVAPIEPQKENYVFAGWYNGDTEYDFTQPVTESIVLTAKFLDPITYNIECNLDGGTASNPTTYNVESEAITLNNPVKLGYTFTGWSGTGLTGEDNMTVTIQKRSIGDRAYKAHYIEKSGYSVEFDTVGGSYIDSKKDLKWTDKVLDGITAPTKDGWEFIDWKYEDTSVTAETAYGELATSDEVMSIELKAQWKDADAPVISGVENGKTYCSAQAVRVSDNDVIVSVTVNGNQVTLDENNQFTLNPAEGTQAIVVTDKAGNVSAEMIVTVNNGHTDENKDHKCDYGCSEEIGEHKALDGKHTCDYCGEEMTTCLDDNKDHLCDICGENVGVHEDNNNDHKCDYGCSEPIGEDESTPDEVLVGDANGDGKVNIKDATEIQKATASIVALDDVQQKAADVNGDGNVNVKDATAIQKYIAGIETGYKIGEYILLSQG